MRAGLLVRDFGDVLVAFDAEPLAVHAVPNLSLITCSGRIFRRRPAPQTLRCRDSRGTRHCLRLSVPATAAEASVASVEPKTRGVNDRQRTPPDNPYDRRSEPGAWSFIAASGTRTQLFFAPSRTHVLSTSISRSPSFFRPCGMRIEGSALPSTSRIRPLPSGSPGVDESTEFPAFHEGLVAAHIETACGLTRPAWHMAFPAILLDDRLDIRI